MPSLLETALGRLFGRTSLRTHHERPWMLQVVVIGKRVAFFEVFPMTALSARISSTLYNGVAAFSKNFCHATTVTPCECYLSEHSLRRVR